MPDRAERMFCDPAFQPTPGLLLPTYANESACVIATINAGLERDGTGATFDVFEGRWSAPISRHSAHLLATAAPALPMGVYSPQLKVWRQVAGRRGLLVWNFAAMLDDVQGHVNELTSFFGLPHVHADGLPQDNALDSPDKLSEMECQTRATLSAWCAPAGVGGGGGLGRRALPSGPVPLLAPHPPRRSPLQSQPPNRPHLPRRAALAGTSRSIRSCTSNWTPTRRAAISRTSRGRFRDLRRSRRAPLTLSSRRSTAACHVLPPRRKGICVERPPVAWQGRGPSSMLAIGMRIWPWRLRVSIRSVSRVSCARASRG